MSVSGNDFSDFQKWIIPVYVHSNYWNCKQVLEYLKYKE